MLIIHRKFVEVRRTNRSTETATLNITNVRVAQRNEKLFTAIHKRRLDLQLSRQWDVVNVTMTHAATTETVTSQARKRPVRAWPTSLAALIGAGAITMLVLWLQPVPRGFDLITTDDYERRTKRFAFLRDARAWMTRFSPKLFGFAPVQISGCYVESDGDEQAHALLGLPPPQYSPNAVRVWILGSNIVARAERNTLSDNRARWRNNTSDGTPSALTMGPGRGSLEFATHPKVRGNNVDLAMRVRSFSVITGGGIPERTNHETAFRMLLKPNEGGIIIDKSGVVFIWAHAPPRQ